MKSNSGKYQLGRVIKSWQISILVFVCFIPEISAQQIQWAKLYPLAKGDYISCIAQDNEGFLYAGGDTERNWVNVGGGTFHNRAMLIKLDPNGDTLFVRDLGIPGKIFSMAIDPYGLIRANITEFFSLRTLFVTITPNGFVLFKDSTVKTTPWACMIGKDSSLVVVGSMNRFGFPGQRSMSFQRIQANGTKDPLIELNPGHPNCVANRVEQLPNGNYLVSGYVGSRIASYELNPDGSNPVFRQWYQTPDLSNFTAGYVSRINGNLFMVSGQGNPSRVGLADSLGNILWQREDEGNQIPPQAMTDGSIAVGYRSGTPPYQTFFRIGADSQYVWNISFFDSLVNRGLFGNTDLTCFTFFEDQSAVIGGRFSNGSGVTGQDPIFIKISNVGTPVTSLSKPKKGPLQNETLAPWPNPTSGTLYLKQHFDKAEVRLYRLSGQEVGQYSLRFGQPIDVSALPGGFYLYRAVIDGKSYSGKVWRSGK